MKGFICRFAQGSEVFFEEPCNAPRIRQIFVSEPVDIPSCFQTACQFRISRGMRLIAGQSCRCVDKEQPPGFGGELPKRLVRGARIFHAEILHWSAISTEHKSKRRAHERIVDALLAAEGSALTPDGCCRAGSNGECGLTMGYAFRQVP